MSRNRVSTVLVSEDKIFILRIIKINDSNKIDRNI